ncbi:hypothetical protein FRC19_011698, partial [Serendipita sp. 401]
MSIAIIYVTTSDTSNTARMEPVIYPPEGLAEYTKDLYQHRLDKFTQNQQEHHVHHAVNFNMGFMPRNRREMMSNELGLLKALMGCWKVLVDGERYENICWRSWSHRRARQANLDSSGFLSRNSGMQRTKSDAPALSLSQTLRHQNEQANETGSRSRPILGSMQRSNVATSATTGHSHYSDLAPKAYSIGLLKAMEKVFTIKDLPSDKHEFEEDCEMEGVVSGPVMAISPARTFSMEPSSPENSPYNLVNSIDSLRLDERVSASEPDVMAHDPAHIPQAELPSPPLVMEPIDDKGGGLALDFQNTPWRRAQREKQIPGPGAGFHFQAPAQPPLLPNSKQILHEVAQKHRLSVEYHPHPIGPEHDRLWSMSAWVD